MPIFPWLFRLIRPAGLLCGLILSLLAIFDLASTGRLAVREPLAILPEAEVWTAETLQAALSSLGVGPGFFSFFALSFSLLFTLAFMACGWLILWNKRMDRFGLYLGLILLIWADGVGIFYSVPATVPWLEELKVYLAWISWPGLFMVLYFFPSGHVRPRWARWFAGLFGGFIIYGLAATAWNFEIVNVYIGFGIIIPCLLIGGYAQVYRYRHAGLVERQQIKWVVLALLVFVLLFISDVILINVAQVGDPDRSSPAAALLASMGLLAVISLVFIGLPVSMSLAMLRYRLWDVDVIIRRTLQYALLSGILVMTYFGGVVLLQETFGRLTGEQGSPLVTVVSTLVIAALFHPLRRRTQDWIDSRFFRSKYDAESALARFALDARDEVDLNRLADAILQVTESTLQPERATLQLRVGPHDRLDRIL